MFKKLKIIPLLYILSLATAIDPWERSFTKKDKLKDEDPNVNNHETVSIITEYKQPDSRQGECKDGLGDNFYKKLLGIIVSRGQFKEREDKMVEGSLHFEFPLSEFKSLKKLLSKTEPFTPDDYRTVDGLISEHLHKLSFIRQLAETWTDVILTWWERYLIQIIICLGMSGCIYAIYKTNWTRISVTYLIMTIFFSICYVWEIMLAVQEADIKDHQEFMKQQQCSWIYFFSDCSSKEIVRQVSHYWYVLHPGNILGNLFTRMVMNNIILVYSQTNKLLGPISEKAPLGLQGSVHILLSVFTLVLIIYIAVALILKAIFNIPFSLSFCFLKFDSYSSNNTNVNGSEQPIRDSLSGGNLNIFMNVLRNNFRGTSNIESNNLERPTNHNSRLHPIRYNPKKHKSRNIAAKSTKSNSICSGKSFPKVSSVTNGNRIHGSGDHLG